MNKFIKICVLVLVFSFLTVEVSIGNITSAQEAPEGDTSAVLDIIDAEIENVPPVVNAGPDQTITLPHDSTNLDGSESSDSDGHIVSYRWEYLSGPSTIDPEDVAEPAVSGLIAGIYEFKLFLTDDDGAMSDQRVSVTVNQAQVNQYCVSGTLTQQEFHAAYDLQKITYNDIVVDGAETTATFTIKNETGCIMPVSLSSYKMFVEPHNPGWLSTQELFEKKVSKNTDASVSFTVKLPECRAQIDAWYGEAPTTLDETNPYQSYSHDPHVIKFKFTTKPLCAKSETATIFAKKIICDSEADLPNWGLGGPNITSTTYSEFLADHPNCHDASWNFEWADDDITPNPGDNSIGATGGDWTSFSSGTSSIPAKNFIWVREILPNANYIPFVGAGNASNVSAEFYCNVDVLNYDNFDFISPVVAGATYNCIAFNVLKAEVTLPQCSDTVDNTDPEDTLADRLDPGCHTDGDASNPASYDANDNDETDGVLPQCSDKVDNTDPEDTLADALDPGCHTDGDATDGDATYDKNDNDETDSTGGGGGGGGGGGSSRPQCSDNKDNSDSEDTLADEKDPGCHTDGNANNPDSYDRRDRSEKDVVGEVLGAETECGIYVEEYLRAGYNNDVRDVVKVQMFLNMYMNAGLATDGVYGPLTEAAVRNFQLARAENVLAPWTIEQSTGIFYLTTQTEVNNIMCPDLGLDIPSPLINWSLNASVDTPAPNPGTTGLYLDIGIGK